MRISKYILLMGLTALLTSCASARAAKKTGVSVKNVAKCTTLVCIQSLPTALKVDEKELDNGLTRYVYRIQRKQGSIFRSFGYGVLALSTLGMSEVVSGPVEGAIQDNKHMAAILDCDSTGDCSRFVIAQHKKPPYIVMGHTAEELAAIKAAEEKANTDKKKKS